MISTYEEIHNYQGESVNSRFPFWVQNRKETYLPYKKTLTLQLL